MYKQNLMNHVNWMPNRNKKTNWLITYPQWDTATWTKERLLQTIMDDLNPKGYAIAEETHEDGGKHYHVYVQLKQQKDLKELLACMQRRWPNDYKRIDLGVVRSKNATLEYLTKEDKQVLTNTTDLHNAVMAGEKRAKNWILYRGASPEYMTVMRDYNVEYLENELRKKGKDELADLMIENKHQDQALLIAYTALYQCNQTWKDVLHCIKRLKEVNEREEELDLQRMERLTRIPPSDDGHYQ